MVKTYNLILFEKYLNIFIRGYERGYIKQGLEKVIKSIIFKNKWVTLLQTQDTDSTILYVGGSIFPLQIKEGKSIKKSHNVILDSSFTP